MILLFVKTMGELEVVLPFLRGKGLSTLNPLQKLFKKL